MAPAVVRVNGATAALPSRGPGPSFLAGTLPGVFAQEEKPVGDANDSIVSSAGMYGAFAQGEAPVGD